MILNHNSTDKKITNYETLEIIENFVIRLGTLCYGRVTTLISRSFHGTVPLVYLINIINVCKLQL